MVHPVNLFDIARKQAQWLAVRQNVIAGNVANANTPGYKAMDTKPFSEVLSDKANQRNLGMFITNPRHIDLGGSVTQIGLVAQDNDEVTNSGNNVDLEQEVSKGADVSQEMQFNTSIVKAFNQMYLKAVKE